MRNKALKIRFVKRYGVSRILFLGGMVTPLKKKDLNEYLPRYLRLHTKEMMRCQSYLQCPVVFLSTFLLFLARVA